MALKKSIPRVATAALTLGGAASGCGDDGVVLTDVESFCENVAYCYGYGSGYIDVCADRYYANVLSYYDAYCTGIIRDMLGCIGDLSSCNDLYYVDFSDCYYEVDDAFYYCGFDFYYYF